jgi:predicted transcriptional regulator
MKTKSKGVRISADLWAKVSEYAENTRPRSTLQYVLEDAVERYLKEQAAAYGSRATKKSTISKGGAA